MNGTNITFDTNALIGYLGGNPALKKYSTSNVLLSIICVVEFLSFPNISQNDLDLLERFLKKVSVISLEMTNIALVNQSAELRKLYKLKLPDAVIAATALLNNCQLVSNDKELNKVPGLIILRF